MSAELGYRASRLADGTRFVTLGGELDIFTTGAELEELLEECVDSRCHLVLDMSQARFIDSTGLALVVRVAKELSTHDRRLLVLSPHPNVRRILELTAIDRWLAIAESWREAVSLLNQPLPNGESPW